MAQKIKHIIFLALVFILANFVFAQPKTKQLYLNSKRISEVLTLIQTSFIYEKDPEKLIDNVIDNMVENLDDEFSYVLSKDEYEALIYETQGSFVGIGIRYSVVNNKAVVVEIMDGSPAQKAGLLLYDEIIQIDDLVLEKPVDFLKIPNKIRGEEGTKVEISVKRNEEIKTFKIKRAKIDFNTVSSKMLDQECKIGYIKISEFCANTLAEFDEAYKNLTADSMQAIVIDLRNNPGGLIDSAVEILKKFFGGYQIILQTKAKSTFLENIYRSPEKAEYERVPMVILVNKYTVSSAEIFAGVMRDLSKVAIIGEKTYGKGSVQIIFRLEDGRALSLTTAKYLTPNKESIDKIGIVPDVSIEDEFSLEYAKKLLSQYLETIKK